MKKAFLFAPALLALSVSTIANAKTYKNVYEFGNSLTDIGNNGCYTAKDENGACDSYTKIVNKIWTNEEPLASDLGGNNHARGRATAIWQPYFGEPNNTTKAQLDKYFASTNGKADSNGVYIHWIGGNDLAAALIAGQQNPFIAQNIVKNSAYAASEQITQLVNAGAGLIIVPNVPDVGASPRLLENVLKIGLNNKLEPLLTKYMEAEGKSPEEIKLTIENTTTSILSGVRTKINQATIPNNDARKKALENVFDGMGRLAEDMLREMAKKEVEKIEKEMGKKLSEEVAKQQIENIAKKIAKDYGIDPKKIAKDFSEGYANASSGATKLTSLYNSIIDDKISQSNGNILRADIYGLLNEVIDNPFNYGFGNNLGYSCGLGVSATECKSGDKDFDDVIKKIFSDNFHPSPLAHKIMGQYIVSTLIAPSQVMTLNQVNRTPVKGTRASLDGHLQQLRHTGNEQGKFGVFGSYTDNRHDSFTLGGDYQLAENFLLGALYSNNKFDRSSVSNFTYEGNGHVATGYALWNLFDNAWLSGDIHYARINYDSLTRNIQLGQANRKETGSTTGKQWGARLTANWDIPVTDIVTTSPIVQFSWDKGDVKGYRESGNNSSAMRFSDQNYTSKVGTLGWRVDTQLGRFNPYASIQFNHQFGDTQYKLRSAMNKSDKLSFVTDSSKQGKDWRQYTIGANANLFGNIHGFASVTRNEGSSQDPNYNFSLGVSSRF